MEPEGAGARRCTLYKPARHVMAMALIVILAALGGAACDSGGVGSRAPGRDGDADRTKRSAPERGGSVEENTIADGRASEQRPETTFPGTTVLASRGPSDRSSERQSWAEQAGQHYRASLGAIEDTLLRLDPSSEVTDEDLAAIMRNELVLRAADRAFRAAVPSPELEEANGHLLEASAGLSDLSYELTEAANSFYPSDRLDDVAEEIALVLGELDAADAAAREQGTELDPRSEAPTPEEVGELFVRLGAESDALERYDTLPEQTGCGEEDPCPI